MSLTRRLFLRNTVVASAVGVTVTTAPAANELTVPTPRERLDAAIAELQAATLALWPDVDQWTIHVGVSEAVPMMVAAHDMKRSRIAVDAARRVQS